MKFLKQILLTITIFLSIYNLVKSQEIQNKPIPTAGKVAKEFLIQNTVKLAKQHELFRTDIDLHPNNYVILNDAAAKTSTSLYEKDSAAYYDPTKLQQKEQLRRDYSIPQQKYASSIYPLDQKPYYGPNDYRVYTNIPDDRVKVKVQLGNLTEKVPSEKNINTLKQQLYSLQNQYNGPKYLSPDTKDKQVYLNDQKPYYDPTSASRQNKIEHLKSTIQDLTSKLNSNYNKPELGIVKVQNHVQNFVNKNQENTNKFIADSYYYSVDKNTLQKERVNSQGVRIGSTDKYYERTEQTLVEAEEKGNLKKKL